MCNAVSGVIHNSNFTSISFDCASPFLATANGQVYTNLRTEDRGKWSYMMEATADDKKYAHGTDKFRDVVLRDGIHETFEDQSNKCKAVLLEIFASMVQVI